MEPPCNSSDSDIEESKNPNTVFNVNSCLMDSPRILSRSVLKIPEKSPVILDSIPTFGKMKTENITSTRLTRPRKLFIIYSNLEMGW